jgi:hypothetical protein
MRFRQVEQLFDAGAEADAEQLAAPEGDQRMRQLVAAAVGIGPRVHETEDPVAAVGRDDDQHGEGDQQPTISRTNRRALRPPRKRMPMAIEMMTTKAPKSGSLSSRMPTNDHRAEHRQEGLLEIVHDVDLAHRVVGGVEHGKQLHQLGRLQIGETKRQPAASAIDVLADAGNQHQRQQHDAGHEQVRAYFCQS